MENYFEFCYKFLNTIATVCKNFNMNDNRNRKLNVLKLGLLCNYIILSYFPAKYLPFEINVKLLIKNYMFNSVYG